jgi:arylsulfatase A-like enzyme
MCNYLKALYFNISVDKQFVLILIKLLTFGEIRLFSRGCIMRKSLLGLTVVGLVVLLFVAWTLFLPPFQLLAPRFKNLVLIGVDTLRADHVSCYGYEKGTTPCIDKLAAGGVRFSRCISQAPWTLPSFATIFTSRYPSQHGAQINRNLRDLSKNEPRKLKDVLTLTGILRNHGFLTHGYVSNPFTAFGMDSDFNYFTFRWGGAHEITDEGIQFLRNNCKKSFFLYLHYNDPHEHHKPVPAPYTLQFVREQILDDLNSSKIAPEYGSIFYHVKHELYDAQISFADSQVGRFLKELRSLGLWGKTLIVLLSDHGEEFFDHEEISKKYGLDPRGLYGYGHGQSLYQELLSVPLIMAGGGIPKGKVVEGKAMLIDVMPTILDYLKIKTSAPMEGISLKSAVAQGQVEDRPAYSEGIAYGYEKKAIQFRDWKYIFSLHNEAEEIYNLEQDPQEKHNLIGQEQERKKLFKKQLAAFLDKGAFNQLADEEEEPLSAEVKKKLQELGYMN